MPRLKSFVPTLISEQEYKVYEENGTKTVEQIVTSKYSERQFPNISENNFKNLKRSLLLLYSAEGSPLDEYFLKLTEMQTYTTGSQNIDSLLWSKGISTKYILEIFGPSSSGKTQLCFTTATLLASTTRGSVLYFDTNNSYSSERIIEIYSERKKVTTDTKFLSISDVLKDKIQVCKIFDVYKLIDSLHQVIEYIKSDKSDFHQNLRLIIIDSIATILTPILENEPRPYQLMSQLSQLMKVIANHYEIAFLITNNQVNDFDNKKVKASLGEFWKQIPNNQIHLDLKPNVQRIAKITKSISLEVSKSKEFMISSIGICDKK